MINLNKITPFNGFYENPVWGQQNNYAWSMAEFGDYIYVGTGRNIIAQVAVGVLGIPASRLPRELVPPPPLDMNAEIWRYKKDGTEDWQNVYKAEDEDGINGFRYMINYTVDSTEILVAAGGNFRRINMLVSTNGIDWTPANNGIDEGNTVRSMIVHNGKLYMGVMNGLGGGEKTILYETTDPRTGWTKVDFTPIPADSPSATPRGEIASMESFNGQLYIGTAPVGGFEVWRTNNEAGWTLVVDKGAGDALNEIPLSMKVFKGKLYVGTGIWIGIVSIDPSKQFVPPKGFEVIKIKTNDKWEVIVGSNTPASPTIPQTIANGLRRPTTPAGLGSPSNAYCWQLEEHENNLYLGTWDWSVLVPTIYLAVLRNLPDILRLLQNREENLSPTTRNISNLISLIRNRIPDFLNTFSRMGGDLWVSPTGTAWSPVSLNGLGNPKNYGIRMLLPASDGRLYVGTANPYQGCEVWRSED